MILALMKLAQVDFDNIQMVLIWVVRMMLLEWATKSQSLCLPSNHIRSKSAKPTRTEDKAVFAACMNSVPPYVHFCNSMDNAPPYVYYCGTRTTGSFSLTGLTLHYVSCKDPEWILALLVLVDLDILWALNLLPPEYDSQQKSQSLCLPWNHIRSKSAKPTRTGNKAVFAACMDSVPPHIYFRISTEAKTTKIVWCNFSANKKMLLIWITKAVLLDLCTQMTGLFHLNGLTIRYFYAMITK